MNEKTQDDSYWLTSGFYTLMERGSVLVFGFGSAIMLFRSFEKAEFGIWILFLTIVAILEVGRIGLLQNALVKYLAASEKTQYAKISTASLVLNFILTLGIVVLLWILSIPAGILMDSEDLTHLLQIYSLTTILLIPFFHCNFVQQANLDFKGVFWSNFTKQGLMFLYVLFLFWSAASIYLIELAIFQIIAAFFGSLVSFLFARKYLSFTKQIDWDWVKKLFHFGKYVLGTNLSTMLYKSIDKMMLGILPGVGPAAVAVYEAAIKVTNMADVPTFSMANILFPQSAKRMKEGKEAIGKLYEKAVGAILSMMIPCIILVQIFADPIIWIVAGPEYPEAANLLRLTILFGLFMPFAVQFGTILDSIGKPKINFWFTMIGMFLNVILNLIFILKFGLFGAVYGTLLTYFITFIFMQILLHQELNVKFYRAFGHIFFFYKKAFIYLIRFFSKKQYSTPPTLQEVPAPPKE